MGVEETSNSSDRLHWYKSTYSGGAGSECLEVADRSRTVHVRGSKDMSRLGLTVGPTAWSAFVGFAAVEAG
jgi:hypothetical protein